MYKNQDYDRETKDSRLSELSDEAYRLPFYRDYARVLHAPAFRRLNGKTQLFPSNKFDFFRNRLTHSLEVSQIARSITRKLNFDLQQQELNAVINEDLVQLAAYAHDIGHPPFGHLGEQALDEEMRNYGGFEGNAQTLRILSCLEHKNFDQSRLDQLKEDRVSFGLNLCMRSYASVIKYDYEIPITVEGRNKEKEKGHISETYHPIKGYYHTERELVKKIKDSVSPNLGSGKFYTIECAIMDFADDIAYSVFDLEDALKGRFLVPLDIISLNKRLLVRIRDKVNKKLNLDISAADIQGIIYDVFSLIFKLDESTELKDYTDNITGQARQQLFTAGYIQNISEKFVEQGFWRTQLTSSIVGQLIREVNIEYNADSPELSKVTMKSEKRAFIEVLKRLTYEYQIESPKLKISEHKGKYMIKKIYTEIYNSKGALLPHDQRLIYDHYSDNDLMQRRVVCDFVASMTDQYATDFYEQLFTGSAYTLFKPVN